MRRGMLILLARVVLATIGVSGPVLAADTGWQGRGEAQLQSRVFAHSTPRFDGRASASLRLEGRFERSGDTRLTIHPIAVLDARDDRRSRLDVAELQIARDVGAFGLSAGLLQVRWGVMDARSSVDVLNQLNLAADPLDPDRLALPALRLRTEVAGIGIDAIVATGFRDRVLPGNEGRVGLPLPLRADPVLEDGAGRGRVEFGLRLDGRIGPGEIALSFFDGYARAPEFDLVDAGMALQARHAVIEQLGLEWRLPLGDWLLRGEAFHRSGQQGGYGGVAAGIERLWFVDRATITAMAEFYHDDRGATALPTVLEHDLVLITRIELPTAGDARIEARMVQDLEVAERLWQLQVDRRVRQDWRLGFEVVVFDTDDHGDPVRALLDPDRKFAFLADEDYVAFRLEHHF